MPITAAQALDLSELIEEVITTRNAEAWQAQTGEPFYPPRPRPLAEANEAWRAALDNLISTRAGELINLRIGIGGSGGLLGG